MAVRVAETPENRGIKSPAPLYLYAGNLPMSARKAWSNAEGTVYDDDGRHVIPQEVREELDIGDGDKVKYINADGVIIFKKKE